MTLPVIFNRKRRAYFLRLVLVAIFQALLAAASIWVVKDLFDALVAGAGRPWDQQQLTALAILISAAGLLGLLRARERIEAEALGQSYAHAVRMRLYDRLGSMPIRELQARSRGGHLLRFVGDLSALRQWISLGLTRLGVALIMAGVALAILTVINPLMALSVSVVIGTGILGAFAMGHELHQATREARRCRALLAADINERISLMAVVQVFSQVRRERRRLLRKSRNLRDAMLARAAVIGRLRGITQALTSMAVALILAAGAFEVSAGRASPGAVVAALSVLGVLTPALRDLSRVYEYWHAYRVAMDRIRQYLGSGADVAPDQELPPLRPGPGGIELRDAAHGETLTNIRATAAAGSLVAIVGANGAGKSTLLSLIAGQLKTDRGAILIDGQDVQQYSRASVQAAIGVVGPDLPLMRGSILRNLRYRCTGATDLELQEVLERCGIADFLESLPEGLMTRVVEGGLNLSSGQRQKISLARALLGRPVILLLDEADADLDSRSLADLKRILKSHQGTVLMVSHRLEQILIADQIWHLADGEIIAAGPARQLYEQPGPTRRLLLQSLGRVA